MATIISRRNIFIYTIQLILIQLLFIPYSFLLGARATKYGTKTPKYSAKTAKLASKQKKALLTALSIDHNEQLALHIRNISELFIATVIKLMETHTLAPHETKTAFLDTALQQTLDTYAQQKDIPLLSDHHLKSMLHRILLNAALELFAIDVHGDDYIAQLKQLINFVNTANDLIINEAQATTLRPFITTFEQAIQHYANNPTQENFTSITDTIDTIKAEVQDITEKAIEQEGEVKETKQYTGSQEDLSSKPTYFLDSLESIKNLFNISFYDLEDAIKENDNTKAEKAKQTIKKIAQKISHYCTLINNIFDPSITNRVYNLRKIGAFLFDKPKELSWCGCDASPFEKRIVLIIRMVQDILKNYPDKEKPLVYTSFASGDLLQDYLLIAELQHQGYTSIDINLIDITNITTQALYQLIDKTYQEKQHHPLPGAISRSPSTAPDLPSTISDSPKNTPRSTPSHSLPNTPRSVPDSPRSYGTPRELSNAPETSRSLASSDIDIPPHLENNLNTELNRSFYRAAFKRKINASFMWNPQEVSRKAFLAHKGIHDTQITVWHDAQQYIAFTQTYPAYKADVMMLTDTGSSLYNISRKKITEANVVALILKNQPETITPRAGISSAASSLHKHEAMTPRSESEPEEKETKEYASAEEPAYPYPEETSEFLYTDISADEESLLRKKLILITLSQTTPTELYTNMLVSHKKEFQQAITTLEQIIRQTPLAPELTQQIASAFSNSNFDVAWFANPFVAYNDMVRAASKKSALVYTLDMVSFDPDRSVIRIFSPQSYLQEPSILGPVIRQQLLKTFSYTDYSIHSQQEKLVQHKPVSTRITRKRAPKSTRTSQKRTPTPTRVTRKRTPTRTSSARTPTTLSKRKPWR